VKKSHRYRKDAAKKQNNMALSFFTISFVNDGIMRLVSRAALDKWQRFLAFNIVQGSMKNYRPVDKIFNIEIRQRINQITGGKNFRNAF
jgi:hypothetical protein